MAKSKLLTPDSYSTHGSLMSLNMLNAMWEDLARNSGWMELALVSGFPSGTVVAPGTPVRLQELAPNNVPYETGKDDPLAVVTRCLQGSRSEFFGLVLDEFQAGHFALARIVLWGRVSMLHPYSHGDLVYINDGGTNNLSNSPYQPGEKPIGEWLKFTGYQGVSVCPPVIL